MKFIKTFLKVIIILAVIAGLVIGGKKLVEAKRAKEAQTPVAKTYDMIVSAISPISKPNRLTLPYIAVTKNDSDVKISSRVPARIISIVTNGKKVKQGDILVTLDNQDIKTKDESIQSSIDALKSQIASKKIALNTLIASHHRTEKLLAVQGTSQEKFDNEVSQIAQIKSGIKTLELKIRGLRSSKKATKNLMTYTTIKAPISGVVTRMSNRGDVAMPGKPLVTISSTKNSYLVVRLPDDIEPKSIIFHGEQLDLKPLNTTYNGLIEYLANTKEELSTNQTVNISVVLFNEVGYMLPHDAILNRNGKDYILIVNEDKAQAKEVKILVNGEEGVIVDNINPNDKIVVAKPDILLKLLSGISVKVKEQ
jgi:multidrug efflux pump subunit AcrA (membrane-fusion protein)